MNKKKCTYFVTNIIQDQEKSLSEIKLYKRRYLMLILFSLYSMCNAFQWLEYSIINDKATHFYKVNSIYVNLTSTIYMFVYIPGIFPASWFLDKNGLRKTVLIGSFGTAFGALIKCASVQQDGFWLTIIGQTIVALSQLFILNLPPKIAAIWFGKNEVSTATSIGVFGNQLGVTFGFFIPPLIVGTSMDINDIGNGLMRLCILTAVLPTILFILVLIFFQDKPPTAPTESNAKAEILKGDVGYINEVKMLITDRNMCMLIISYGINTGVFYAISTLLNHIISFASPGNESKAGIIGAGMTVSGTIGSMISGVILDKTHCYRGVTILIYIFSFIGLIGFTLSLSISLTLAFILACFLGFFMTGYLPIGFEYAAELSFPISEGTSAGLLNVSSQIFGIKLCYLTTILIERFSYSVANYGLVLILLFGLILTFCINGELKRQKALS